MPMPGVGLTPFSSIPHQAPVETKKDPGLCGWTYFEINAGSFCKASLAGQLQDAAEKRRVFLSTDII